MRQLGGRGEPFLEVFVFSRSTRYNWVMVTVDSRFALVVDDEQIVHVLVREALEERGFEVEIAHDAREARGILEELELDIVIIDLDLGQGPSGADLAYFVAKEYPDMVRLVLTKHPGLATAGIPGASLPEGTSFLSKEKITNYKVLGDAVDSVLQGKRVFRPGSIDRSLAGLSAQQLQILRMMAQGYTTAEIARRRDRTHGAVEKMSTRVYKQLGLEPDGVVNPRTEAIRFYCRAFGTPARTDDDTT